MPSPFELVDADLQSAIDATFGEGINIRPQAGDANYGGGADPARPAKLGVHATVSRNPVGAAPTDFIGTVRNGALVAQAPSEAWLDRAAVVALGYALRRGDIIEFPGAGARAVVADVRAGDFGDLTLIFSAAGPIP